MASNPLALGVISEQSIAEYLQLAKGDIFVASAYLGVTPSQLNRYIRQSDWLQLVTGSIEQVKANPEYERMSTAQFAQELERLTKEYKVVGLEVIHELATMPFESAAMAEVKLKAAIQLRSAGSEQHQDQNQTAVFQELNRLYQQAAPRIRSIRAVQVEFEGQDQPTMIVDQSQ